MFVANLVLTSNEDHEQWWSIHIVKGENPRPSPMGINWLLVPISAFKHAFSYFMLHFCLPLTSFHHKSRSKNILKQHVLLASGKDHFQHSRRYFYPKTSLFKYCRVVTWNLTMFYICSKDACLSTSIVICILKKILSDSLICGKILLGVDPTPLVFIILNVVWWY